MKQYQELIRKVLNEGNRKEDRTGTGTMSIFGHQMRFDLQKGFPLVTTKRVPFNLVVSELLWFLRGDNNIKFLLENNNHIWDEWAFKRYVESSDYNGPDMTNFGIRSLNDDEFNKEYQKQMKEYQNKILSDNEFAEKHGGLGNVYGVQWMSWKTDKGAFINQIENVINEIKTNPDSRRLIVSAWNPSDIPNMALPPCHTMFQFYVHDNKLSCQLYQRSADIFLGVPFNIASYSLLIHLIAKETGLDVGEFVHTIGDAHLYLNHIDQAKMLLERECKELPRLIIEEKSVDGIYLEGYDPHPTIKAPIAV